MSDTLDFKTKYLMYKAKYINLKKQQKGGGDDKIDIILFKGEYCGHCKRFMPVWNTLNKYYVNDSRYNFLTYDAEKNKDIFNQYKIDGVPTIYVLKGNDKKMYDGPRDLDSLKSFLG